MKSVKLILLIVSIVYHTADGQPTDTIPTKIKARHYVKFGPLHFANFYPTIQLAYEYRWNKSFSVQADVGYVLSYNNDERFINMRGLKLKPEFRYYVANTDEKQPFYLAIEPYLHMVNFDRDGSTVECFDAECTQTYSRRYFYTVKYREQGFAVKAGLTWYSGHFLIDLNWGLRVRNINYIKPAFDENFFLAIPNEQKRVGMLPLMGLRVGWRFY